MFLEINDWSVLLTSKGQYWMNKLSRREEAF
ncbi:hypothetical protein LINGRAHAP2_LOCUS37189 [Linum grandiflorum]